MIIRKDIEFKSKELTLRGWLYQPPISYSTPCIIMTHGFSALKEHGLDAFATYFANAGMHVLVYDHPNFGNSDGEPRFEVDPILQINAMHDAISFAQNLNEVNPKKIGLWGTSFSAGLALCVSAFNKNITCIVAQVPFVKGHHDYLRMQKPEEWIKVQKHYQSDHKARQAGKRPIMVPVVSDEKNASAIMKQIEARIFFTSIKAWENKVTLKSLENAGEFKPIDLIVKINHIPILFIVVKQDKINPTSLALDAYEKLQTPKKLIMIDGHHFAPYQDEFNICVSEACDWFKKYLLNEAKDDKK